MFGSSKSKQRVAELFRSGETEGGMPSLFINENILYSYGRHYALAIRLDYEDMMKSGYSYVINSTYYSQTTSTQAGVVRCALSDYI